LKIGYLVLLGDIIGSKKLSQLDAVLDKLQRVLQDINKEYAASVITRFGIVRGDELQGLLKPSADVYRIVNTIAERMSPVKIRFGIGHGALAEPKNAKKRDPDLAGSAFDKACEALELARDIKGYAVILQSDQLNPERLEEINFILRLLAVIRNLWSDRFFQIVPHLRAGKKQADIAGQYGITQPYISEIKKQACWQEVRILEEKAFALLGKDFRE